MNLSDVTRTLHEGSLLGDVFSVELLKQVQAKLSLDSDLSDWESDYEELMDVCVVGITGRNMSAKTPRINVRNDACMVDSRIYHHSGM